MRWEKIGRIFCPDNNASWMVSHAANPLVMPLDNHLYRVYFNCRDAQNRSYVGWFEFDPRDPFNIQRVSSAPVLTPGAPGLFDDSGVSLGCLVPHDSEHWLYFVGWNLCTTVPWRNSIGLASATGAAPDEFQKTSRAPLIDRSEVDPFSLSYPWVLREGTRWRMWYGTNITWGPAISDMRHVIKYAESDDGQHWQRTGRVAVGLAQPDEVAMSRPYVIKDPDCYRMWYSFRGAAYRIGYAESQDGLTWERRDALAGIDVSESGWDSDMIEYACVFDAGSARYMLYNGNRYGQTGLGLAVLAAP
jgi:hypothetical protein